MRQLVTGFKYRLDTNFAKMDRIVHPEVEAFKTRVLGTEFSGLTIQQWSNLFSQRGGPDGLKTALEERLQITDQDSESILLD